MDLSTFTKEILTGKLTFLSIVTWPCIYLLFERTHQIAKIV